MNIVLLCGSLSYAGAQRQLFELAKGLNEKHQVIVCSISSNVPLLQDFKSNNVRVEVFGLRKRNFVKIIRGLNKLLISNKIQVVYSFLETANTYSRIMKFLIPGIKIVASERSSDNKINFRAKLLEKSLSKVTDLYIANSYAGKKALRKNYNIKKVKVIHNGIDKDRFLSGKKSSLNSQLGRNIIISQIGRIKPDKNYEMFLKVAEKVCELHKDVVFLAIGDQPNSKDAYQKIILKEKSKLKNKDRILFIGKRSDIPEILSETDVSILTSHREGCSNTVLESMFAKCPIVVTDVGDNKIMLSEANQDFIVKPDDVADMVKKISILIDDLDLRKRIGNENYKKAQKEFTKEMMVENTESVISTLLETDI
ncbi:MAG: hypothetical protein DRJ07_01745 [Bacteroidetes bacterium]|nr:MAG: hypothetical protein DRJ07_01745 [Bacteroidota bacterium]